MSDVGTGILGFVGMSALAGVLITAAVTPALAVTGMAANNGISMFENLPGYLNIDALSQKTDIYATQPDGSQAHLASFFDENREQVTWDAISQYVKDAAVSGEDPRFYEHGGVDIQGTIRGALSTYVLNQDVQGGSSITQQYVKNVLINNGVREAKTEEEKEAAYDSATETSPERKLKEMRYAIALEKEYSKDEILLGYLNIAAFGGRVYGIESAASVLLRQARGRPVARRGGEPHRDREPPREVPPRLPRERDERRRHRRRRPAGAVRRQQGAPRLHPRRDAEAQEDHAGGVRRRDRDAGHPRDHRAEHRLPDRSGQRLLLRLRRLDHQEPVRRPRDARHQRGRPDAAAGRPADLHHARPRAAEQGRDGDRRERALHRPALRRRLGRGDRAAGHRPHPRHGAEQEVLERPRRHRDESRVHLGELQHRLRVRRIQRPPARIDVQGLHPRRVAERGPLPHARRSTARAARSRRSPTAAPATGAAATTRATTTAASRTTRSTPPRGR